MPFRKKHRTDTSGKDDGWEVYSISESSSCSEVQKSAVMVAIDDQTLTDESEGIEVEAVEFARRRKRRKKKIEKHTKKTVFGCPRRLVLLAVAFLLIMTVSALAGFLILNSKNAKSNASALEEEGADVIDVTKETDKESETTDTAAVDIDAELEGEIDLADEGNSTSIEEEEEPPYADVVITPTATPTEGDTGQTSKAVAEEGTEAEWGDHALTVSSSCVEGLATAVSVASFRFSSKRDGDWYWIRGVTNTTTSQYDSWEYTDEREGELPLLNLASGGSYQISLVRDSMQPYDEIISHNFTIPACPVNAN